MSVRAVPAKCILLTFVIPMATNCVRCMPCQPHELSPVKLKDRLSWRSSRALKCRNPPIG